MKKAYLVRHGHIDKVNRKYDTLNDEGIELSLNLPGILKSYGADILQAFYENDDGARCENTIAHLSCQRTPYGDRADLRNINEVLKNGKEEFVICYRAPNIECGALYHVDKLDLHTPFSNVNYLMKVRNTMKLGYQYIYVLSEADGKWAQVDSIPTGFDYNGKIDNK